MAINIKNTKTVANNGIKMLVYGQAGAGKTSLIKTLPAPIVLSAEAGLLSIAGADIPYIEIHNFAELEEAYNYVKNHSSEYGTVVLDSISEIAEVVLAAEKDKAKDPRQAYGALLDTMNAMIRAFRDLPLNVYFSAKMDKIQDDTARIYYGPSSPGTKVSQALPYFFDEVFALRVEKNQEGTLERWLQTFPDGVYVAKDRSGKLQDFEKPDLGKIIQKIGGRA
jgi:phage nucleotide-binding protein